MVEEDRKIKWSRPSLKKMNEVYAMGQPECIPGDFGGTTCTGNGNSTGAPNACACVANGETANNGCSGVGSSPSGGS